MAPITAINWIPAFSYSDASHPSSCTHSALNIINSHYGGASAILSAVDIHQSPVTTTTTGDNAIYLMTVIACQGKMNRSITTLDRSSHNATMRPWWQWGMVGLTLITHCDLEHKSKEEEEEEATTRRVCNGTVSLSNRERSALECTGPHNMHIAFVACLPIHELCTRIPGHGTERRKRRRMERRGCLIVRRANKNSDVNKMEIALFWLLIDILGILPRASLSPLPCKRNRIACVPRHRRASRFKLARGISFTLWAFEVQSKRCDTMVSHDVQHSMR